MSKGDRVTVTVVAGFFLLPVVGLLIRLGAPPVIFPLVFVPWFLVFAATAAS